RCPPSLLSARIRHSTRLQVSVPNLVLRHVPARAFGAIPQPGCALLPRPPKMREFALVLFLFLSRPCTARKRKLRARSGSSRRMEGRVIAIRGAREHNLKNVDLEIPRDRLVVFTGLSGSGKSSLAFDTIYAEGQRRYVESLSAYARQFLEMMQKPDVDQIDGLSPAISIEQKTTSKNPRSTVGTV